MKNLILINNHSFVDVITNSSSELFICNTGKSIEFVKEILAEMLQTYSKATGKEYIFDHVFGDIYLAEEKADQALKLLIEWDIPWNIHNKLSEETTKDPIPEMDYSEGYEVSVEKRNAWIARHREDLENALKGFIFIESWSDNSIPYGLFSMIEDIFNADRKHMG